MSGEFQKYDTFSETTYLVRLAQDAKVFTRDKGDGDDVVLTFCDNTRITGTEDLWVDARVARFISERAKGFRKGDEVQIKGKLRFKRQNDGTMRGKIYDAMVNSFVKLRDRNGDAPTEDPVPPTFE
jgi:hypothetical protein